MLKILSIDGADLFLNRGHQVNQVLKASSVAGVTRVCQVCVAQAVRLGWQGPR